MCQPRSEGGRRCPIHRHDSVAYLQLTEKDSGLNIRQVENIFRELSREGRHTEDPTEAQWRTMLSSFQSYVNERRGHQAIKNNLTKAFDNFTVPDGKTYYALRKIRRAAETKSNNLEALFTKIAIEKGSSVADIKSYFNRYSNAVDISRGSETPEGYSQRAYLFAKNNNLPYDKASVVAIEKLKTLPVQIDNTNRVSMHDVSASSNVVSNIGYNAEGGRIELVMKNSPDTTYAYKNVPEEEWNETYNNGDLVYSKMMNIMTNPEYKYANEAEEAADRCNIRCESCGQFASPVSHTCPERVAEEAAVPAQNNDSVEDLPSVEAENTPTLLEEFAQASEIAAIQSELDAPAVMSESDTSEDVAQPVITPLLTSEGYNSLNPVRVNQLENAINRVEIERSALESNANRDYRYGKLKNHATAFIWNSDYNIDFGSFEEELREDVSSNRNNLFLTYQSYVVGNTRSIAREYKVLGTFGANSFSSLRVLHEKILVDTFNENIKVYDENISFSEEEIEVAKQEKAASEIPTLEKRTGYTRVITYDSSLITQPKIKIPKVADLKKAMRDNESFYMPIELDSNSAVPQRVRLQLGEDQDASVQDDQGYRQTYNVASGIYNSNITGDIQFKKQADGSFQAVEGSKLLKCNCNDWRTKRYCIHIDNLNRRANNILHQSVQSNGNILTRAQMSALPNAQYLTAALSRRTDLVITPPSADNENELNYTFSQLNTNDRSAQRFKNWFVSRSNAFSNKYNVETEDTTSFEAFDEARKMQSTIGRMRNVSSIDNFKPLIKAGLSKNGTVTVPFNSSFQERINVRTAEVSGTITYAKDSDGNTYIKGDNLQCDCPDYREDYRCIHIKATHQAASCATQADDELYSYGQGLSSYYILNRQEPERQKLYEQMMIAREEATDEERDSLTVEELKTRAEARIAQQAADRAAREHRQAEQAAARLVEYRRNSMRQSRSMSLPRSERQTNQINEWKQENPERAAAIVAYRENMMNKWENVEPSYTNNPELATTAIASALARKANGENPIEFRSEGVLDGMSDGPAGRKFGIELEFDVPRENRRETLRKIGRELYEAGLTTTSSQVPYHSAGNNGYATWSFEEDCTVDAELVSPILDDSPESWEQVRKATEIITRNGGKATTRAGSHVHISTGSYENSSAKRAELLRFNREHQDMVYRLASDPKRGTHRGWSWCAPNVDDNAGEISDEINDSTYLFRGDHDSHGVGLNMGAMQTNLTSSNVEFRMWDATLDAGTIQAQVMLSAAMTDYAERTVIKEKKSLVRDSVSTIGSAASENKDRHDLTGNTGFSSFVDKLFRKDEDKSQVASLFAVTNWQRSS